MQEFVMTVTGMMCPHCEATVRKCLEAFPEVQRAVPNHEKNIVTLYLQDSLVHLEEMRQALAEAGYQAER